jgi:hypothetical protein
MQIWGKTKIQCLVRLRIPGSTMPGHGSRASCNGKPSKPTSSWCSQQCGDLIEFLAFSGCRLSEAGFITWKDVDLGRAQFGFTGIQRPVQRPGTGARFRSSRLSNVYLLIFAIIHVKCATRSAPMATMSWQLLWVPPLSIDLDPFQASRSPLGGGTIRRVPHFGTGVIDLQLQGNSSPELFLWPSRFPVPKPICVYQVTARPVGVWSVHLD